MLKDEEGKINADWGKITELSRMRNGPSRRTITYWIKHELEGVEESVSKKQRVVKSALTDEEKYVVGGKVLSRIAHHKTVDTMFVQNWIVEAYGIEVSNSTVCRYMKELGFKSKRASESIVQTNEADSATMISWLNEVRSHINDEQLSPSDVVCMDQISLWDHGIPLRSYGVVGG